MVAFPPPAQTHSPPAGAILTIDLAALVANWRHLGQASGARQCAAVVKADAYGLGARAVVSALADAGCRAFFVAHLDEALAIADLIPANGWVAVLNGLMPGAEGIAAANGVLPVLNSLAQARRWQAEAHSRGRALPALLQVDSGMSRLGLCAEDAAVLARDADFRAKVPLLAIMSHLACAD
ncbi:MAG TPA: alanine racemase, partial [Novosphingobium sp.]|nr:alanine racemase [Novosphingobium sp.]